MTDKKTKAIDIADFDTGVASDKGFDLEILTPDGKNMPTGVFITVLGKHSEVFREYIREQINERSRKEAAAARKNNPLPPITAEEAERQAVESLVVSTTGWFTAERDKQGNIINKVPTFPYRGENLSYTTANALKVYSEQIWLRAQVDEAIGDLENFFKG